jgi:hypothetical protein
VLLLTNYCRNFGTTLGNFLLPNFYFVSVTKGRVVVISVSIIYPQKKDNNKQNGKPN